MTGLRYCPTCGDEFEAWVVTCPDCRAPLGSPPPPTSSPRDHAMTQWDLAAVELSERQMLSRYLDAEGIGFEWHGGVLVASRAHQARVHELVEMATMRRVAGTEVGPRVGPGGSPSPTPTSPAAAVASAKGCALVIAAVAALHLLVLVPVFNLALVDGTASRWLGVGLFTLWTMAWAGAAGWMWRRADRVAEGGA